METENISEQEEQHSNALGQLMENPELLRQLVDQIPGGGQGEIAGVKGTPEKDDKKKQRKPDEDAKK